MLYWPRGHILLSLCVAYEVIYGCGLVAASLFYEFWKPHLNIGEKMLILQTISF